jgi:tRNA threonylcarbamoyladenosine biosynthesis protein TsaB
MILAIETATEICSAAVVMDGAVRSVRSLHEKNIHSEKLLSLIDEVLAESGCDRKQLKSIAVSIGPGSFTGLRIGLSTAKGLAMALDLPLIAVPTLDGIAESFRRSRTDTIPTRFCAMIDAKRDEAFYAFYSVDRSEIIRTGDYAITGKNMILPEAARTGAAVVQPEISAASIGLLGERRSNEFMLQEYSTAEPLYLRDFIATLPKNKV